MVLITPPEQHLLMEAGDRPDLGTLYVASSLKRKGHLPVIVDLNHMSYNELKKNLIGADFIGITTKTPYFSWFTQYAAHLKHNFPEIQLIAGGPHASADPGSIKQYFDYVVVGEGENAIIDIVEGRVAKGRVQFPYEENLDNLAPPNWDLIKAGSYGIRQEGRRTWPLLTSRSCPFNCCFCTKDVLGPVQRRHSIERVIQEVKEIINKVGVNSFYIYDDYFVLDRERALEFSKKIIDNKLRITFRAITRTDTLSENVLIELKKAGLRSLDFGFEHADDEVLKKIDKQNNVANHQRAIDMCKKHGVRIRGSFIVNLPGATRETAFKTLEFVKANNFDWADFYPLVAYPNTPLWKNSAKFGVSIEKRFDLFQSGFETNVESEKFPKSEVPRVVKEIREEWCSYKKSRVPFEMQ